MSVTKAMVKMSKIHRMDVSNFFGSLHPKDLIDQTEKIEGQFELEDVKDPKWVTLSQTQLKGHASLWRQ